MVGYWQLWHPLEAYVEVPYSCEVFDLEEEGSVETIIPSGNVLQITRHYTYRPTCCSWARASLAASLLVFLHNIMESISGFGLGLAMCPSADIN